MVGVTHHIEQVFNHYFGGKILKKSSDRLRRVMNAPKVGKPSRNSDGAPAGQVINVGLDPLMVLLHSPECVTLALVMPLFTDANGRDGLAMLPLDELHDAKEVRGNVLRLKFGAESTAVRSSLSLLFFIVH